MKQETVAPMILRSARVCHSVVSNSFATPWTEACQAPRLWNYPGVITGVGCHFLLQGIFLTQGSNPGLLLWQAASLPLTPPSTVHMKSFNPLNLKKCK